MADFPVVKLPLSRDVTLQKERMYKSDGTGEPYPNSRIQSSKSCRKLVERLVSGCRNSSLSSPLPSPMVAAIAEWYRYRIVACLVTSSSPVPLKTRRVGQRCTLNLSRVETSSRWCGVVVRRGGVSSGVVPVT
ncbi:uncharacterized protein TNCV_4128391 [Trichonephila clavipes]|nr:uncharacterized protein TNCV_4128391 [Trichonephila clavipes]